MFMKENKIFLTEDTATIMKSFDHKIYIGYFKT